ncbi:hypothetical protein CULT_1930003 [[Clostridium] ultunense Esp]|nr:hypothetical protein CULT_1930003 [[Clostridium] ultunense Esp]
MPLKSMDKVGKIVLSTEGNILEEIDLIIHKDVKKENLIMRILRNIKEFIVNVFKIDKLTIFRILIKK